MSVLDEVATYIGLESFDFLFTYKFDFWGKAIKSKNNQKHPMINFMEKNYTLRIKTSCDQVWGQMLPNEDGRFCFHCEKTVVDFTMMLDEEIALYLHQHQGEKFCSRMTMQQRNRSYTYLQSEDT